MQGGHLCLPAGTFWQALLGFGKAPAGILRCPPCTSEHEIQLQISLSLGFSICRGSCKLRVDLYNHVGGGWDGIGQDGQGIIKHGCTPNCHPMPSF